MTRLHVLRRARIELEPGVLRTRRPTSRLRARCARLMRDETGSATAEYAVVILAAVAFAGVLVGVMRSHEVEQILTDLVRGALTS